MQCFSSFARQSKQESIKKDIWLKVSKVPKGQILKAPTFRCKGCAPQPGRVIPFEQGIGVRCIGFLYYQRGNQDDSESLEMTRGRNRICCAQGRSELMPSQVLQCLKG